MKKMVPKSLKTWFLIHFIADMVFAIPLLIVPVWFLQLLGFTTVEPLSARLIGAALIAIGGNSFLMRNKSVDTYLAMLNLKLLWSSFAVIGIFITIMQGGPLVGWAILLVFLVFFFIWLYFKRRIV